MGDCCVYSELANGDVMRCLCLFAQGSFLVFLSGIIC